MQKLAVITIGVMISIGAIALYLQGQSPTTLVLAGTATVAGLVPSGNGKRKSPKVEAGKPKEPG